VIGTSLTPDGLDAAREAHARADWSRTYEILRLLAADGLTSEDRYRLAEAAWWLGRTDEALVHYERAYADAVEEGQVRRAAMVALEVGFLRALRGEFTAGSGWLGRADRLLDPEPPCPEKGYTRYIEAEEALERGDLAAAAQAGREVRATGDRFGDRTLTSLGLVVEGIALIREGTVREGFARLDEALLPVLAGEVEHGWAGNIYCQMMALCHDLSDPRRAQEWTEATERWCAQFPNAAMFAGICRVHRAQLHRGRGDWAAAEREALRVCDELASMNVAAVGEARYQLGEVLRLRDDAAGAEAAYRQAARLGRDPQPGLALLHLARGEPGAAAAGIATALAAVGDDPFRRVPLRAAEVTIALATGEIDTAEGACSDLRGLATIYVSPGFEGTAWQAEGATLLARGRPGDAMGPLRDACRRWLELRLPHNEAATRVLIARACAALGDDLGSRNELDLAADTFTQLGAVRDLEELAELRGERTLPDGLTEREIEVLACVADGSTNREIAAELFISEKTVARHLSNIFSKAGVSSRTAAARYALERGLVPTGRG
jgi:DNA-binding CsgD family transcriptional regulator